MRGVFKRIRHAAVLAALVTILGATAVAAAPREQPQRFLDRVVAWLQSRISIPPGNS